MTNRFHPLWSMLCRTTRAGRALRDDARGSALVEAALILPIALATFALLIYGAEGFAIQRKVTLTARTVTDLVTQATPTQYNNGASVVNHTAIDNLLCAAAAVIQPYSSSNMTMVVSQVKVDSTGTTAKVQWSEPYNGGTARTVNQVITLPGTIGSGQAGNYFVLGEVSYGYTPLNLFVSLNALTLSGAIYLTPRQSTSITCGDCASHS